MEGKSLDELIRSYGKELLGEKVMERFGTTFPLLIKFIDARDNLSIQVHPDDELAKKRHNSFGKTEMWYVIKAEKGAGLYSGFSEQIDAEEYVKRVENNTIMDVLQRYDVNDCLLYTSVVFVFGSLFLHGVSHRYDVQRYDMIW